MIFNNILNYCTNYVQANPLGGIAVGVILLFLLVKRTKAFLILVLIVAAGIGVMTLFDTLSSSGVSQKDFKALKEVQ